MRPHHDSSCLCDHVTSRVTASITHLLARPESTHTDAVVVVVVVVNMTRRRRQLKVELHLVPIGDAPERVEAVQHRVREPACGAR
jgi:hypothetical protein